MDRIANARLSAPPQFLRLGVFLPLLIIPMLLGSALLGQQQDGLNPPSQRTKAIVYRLAHADAEVVRQAALSLPKAENAGNVRHIVADPKTNSLIVLADSIEMPLLTALIEKIDQPFTAPITQPAAPVHLLVQLVMDLGEEDSAIPLATPVEPRTREWLSEAAKAGLIRPMTQPHTVTHSLISVTPGSQQDGRGKVVTSSSAAEEKIGLELTGTLKLQEAKLFQLSTKIQITVRQAGESEEKNAGTASAQIQTDTTIYRKDYPILLSVNTVEGRSFLVIVEVK